MKWTLCLVALVALVCLSKVVRAEAEDWDEDDHEALVRQERGATSRANESCRYSKGPWSECDNKTNTRTRTLTLKKGDSSTCEQTKTMLKKCKKACRYDKGAWSECSNGRLTQTRTDSLRPTSDPSCEQARTIIKKCKSKAVKKGKGNRRSRQ